MRTRGNLADRAERAGCDLTGSDEAERELADAPPEPDRRLPEGDHANRDLPNRDEPDGDLPDGDEADRWRPAAGCGVDSSHHVHQG